MFKRNDLVRRKSFDSHKSIIPEGVSGTVQVANASTVDVLWNYSAVGGADMCLQKYLPETADLYLELIASDQEPEAEMPESGWSFNESVAPVFNKHVRQSVPMYEEIHNMIEGYSKFFIRKDSFVYDLGTSTGEALIRLSKLHKDKRVDFMGIDNSDPMIQEATNAISDARVTLVNEDISRCMFFNASFILAVLTLQFLPIEARHEVVRNVYDGLHYGGAFIMVEKVNAEDAIFQDLYTQLYHDFKSQQGLSLQEIWDKQRSIRGVMNPLTATENLEMLMYAGFKKIDIFFKWNNFIGIIAIK